MRNIGKTLFGQIYYLNKQSHFQMRNTNLYCESFFIPDKFIYGIMDFKQLSKNDLFSNLTIGDKDNTFKIQECYRFINNIETVDIQYFKWSFEPKNTYNDIDKTILKTILIKSDIHIINCSCCHRYQPIEQHVKVVITTYIDDSNCK